MTRVTLPVCRSVLKVVSLCTETTPQVLLLGNTYVTVYVTYDFPVLSLVVLTLLLYCGDPSPLPF